MSPPALSSYNRMGEPVARDRNGWLIDGVDLSQTVLDLFLRRVSDRPQATAVTDGSGRAWSYAALAGHAQHLAERLRVPAPRRGVRVGLALPAGGDLVAAALASWSLGLVAVPVDLDQPRERNALMINDARASVVVAVDEAAGRQLLPDSPGSVVATTDTADDVRGPWVTDDQAVGEDPSLLLFTSGSTGPPKGVLLGQAGLSNHLQSTLVLPGMDAADRMLCAASPAFDMCWSELLLPLVAGGNAHILERGRLRDAEAVGEFLRAERVTVALGTPSLWEVLLENGLRLPEDLSLWLGGEPVPTRLARRAVPQASSLWNLYGPTEASMFVCCSRISGGADEAVIGWPVANTSASIEGPTGVGDGPGELVVEGPGVALGYDGLADQTRQRFVQTEAGRSFRTGDTVRRGADGALSFLGRGDRQVKIRGNRVELGEVEAALLRHPDVAAAQVGTERRAGRLELVANVVSPRADLTPADLSRHLRTVLPGAMTPHRYRLAATMALSSNGKSILTGDDDTHDRLQDRAACSSGERAVARAWAAVLGHYDFDLDDRFGDVGGDSLGVVRLINEARRLGLPFGLALVGEAETVRAQAALAGDPRPPEPPATVPVHGLVPLLPIQRRFLAWGLDEPTHYVLPVLLRLDAGVSVDRLRDAVDALVAAHACLRSRVAAGDPPPLHVSPPATGQVPLESRRVPDDDALPHLLQEMHRSLDLTGPLVRVAVVHVGAGETPAYLLIVLHHLVCDGYGLAPLVADLQALYADARAAPAGPTDLPQHALFLQSWADSPDARAGARALLDRPWSSVRPIPLVGARPAPLSSVVARTLTLPPSESARFSAGVRSPASGRVHGPELLLVAAITQTLQELTRNRVQLLDICRHGRVSPDPTADLSRAVGWFATVCPYLLDPEPTVGQPEFLDATHEQMRAVRDVENAYGATRWMAAEPDLSRRVRDLPAAQVYLNYRGTDIARPPVAPPFSWTDLGLGPTQTTRGPQQYAFKLWADVREGELLMQWFYAPERQPETVVETLVDGVRDRLVRFLGPADS